MLKYTKQTRFLAAVDCIIFGFDGSQLKILLVKRGFEPEKGKWSLIGGFVKTGESLEEAANRVLFAHTGLNKVYLEQMHTFGNPDRDPIEQTLSVAYFSLFDISKYKHQLSNDFHAEWFPLNEFPKLIFDHTAMVKMARTKLKYKASLHPLLFELLPSKFTIPQLQSLFEDVYETKFDKRNFNRKMSSTGMLVKLKDKDYGSSKKGAFFYKLDQKHYKKNFHNILRFIPNPNGLL